MESGPFAGRLTPPAAAPPAGGGVTEARLSVARKASYWRTCGSTTFSTKRKCCDASTIGQPWTGRKGCDRPLDFDSPSRARPPSFLVVLVPERSYAVYAGAGIGGIP